MLYSLHLLAQSLKPNAAVKCVPLGGVILASQHSVRIPMLAPAVFPFGRVGICQNRHRLVHLIDFLC